MRQTIDVQRLLLLALNRLGPSIQFRLLALIYTYHFERGYDTADTAFLAKLASMPIPGPGPGPSSAKALFDSEHAARQWLDSGELRQEILDSSRLARQRGVKAMPMVLVNGRYAIVGAQEEDKFRQVSERAVQSLIASSLPRLPTGRSRRYRPGTPGTPSSRHPPRQCRSLDIGLAGVMYDVCSVVQVAGWHLSQTARTATHTQL